MNDIDGILRHIDSLIHKYFTIVFIIRTNDIHLRSFAYNFNVLFTYSNLRHVKHTDILPEYTTVSTASNPPVLYHNPVLSLLILSILTTPISSSLPRFLVQPKDIM